MEKSSKKNRILPETNQLPSLKEIQFSDSIKHKLYSVSNGEKKKTESSTQAQTHAQNKASYVDKYKAKKVLVKVQEPPAKHSSINSDPLKLHNSSQISFAASNGKSKKSKKGILKKTSKKVKFIKNEDFEKKILKNQENTKFTSDFHAVDKIKEKKIDFFDEDNEEFVMSIDSESDENDENVVSIGSNQEDPYEYSFHTRRYHIPSPRYTMLINEIEYYKHKIYLLQQENSNMHLKISILEDKLMTKANNNNNNRYKGKVLVIHEDKELLDENVETEFSNEPRLKKKPNKQKKSLIDDTLPSTTFQQTSSHVSEKKNENFVENYEIFMKNLQKKINETESAIEHETSNVKDDNNTQIEQMNISYLFKTPTNSANQKGSRKNSPLVFTNNEALVETPRRDSPSNKTFTKQVNSKIVGELSKPNSSFKLPVLMKSKPQLVTASYTYEDIQNEELEELKKKINDDLFF